MPQEQELTNNFSFIGETNDNYTKFSVILGRDLIFIDWTVNFGGQILGLILGMILGFIFGAKMGTLFDPTTPVDVGAYIALQAGILLCIVGLTLYYTSRLGIKLNSPKKIANNKILLLKTCMFAFTAIFGIVYLFNNHIFPYIYANFSTIKPPEPGDTGTGGDGSEGNIVDIPTTNHYILLITLIVLVVALFAILYAGVFYSFNKKANTMTGVAIIVSTLMLTLTLLSQNRSIQKLIDGEVMAFLTDFLYFFLVAIITLLTYHMSRRIELSVVILFIGFAFGFGAPSNVVAQIIALKWGFPNLADGVNSTADVITQTITIIEYVGLFGLVVYPIIFYKDTIAFLKEFTRIYKLPLYILKFIVTIVLLPWIIIKNLGAIRTFWIELWLVFKKDGEKSAYFSILGDRIGQQLSKFFKDITSSEGFAVTLFTIVILVIELAIVFLYNILGIFLYFLAFIILVGVLNKIITSRYGSISYTALFTSMTKSALQMSAPLIPSIEQQEEFFEYKPKKVQKLYISLGTTIPVIAYYLIAYTTTAITTETPFRDAFFLLSAVPISIGIISFSTSYFYVKKPIMKEIYSYPLRIVSIIGAIIYFGIAINRLIYNTVGSFPLFLLFFLPLIYLTIRTKRSLSELLLLLAGEKRNQALNELILRKELNTERLKESLYDAPPFLRFWIILVFLKREEHEIKDQLALMLKSEYYYDRIIASLAFLYSNDQENIQQIIYMLENDPDVKVREAIAYGLRYFKEINDEDYKRILDAQHYEDNSKVLEKLRETIAILDQRFAKEEEEEEILEELI
ncbi:MAG: hypothetical protein ACTSQE_01590 [Candidatus Heimdallarchaeaceae archaeon]